MQQQLKFVMELISEDAPAVIFDDLDTLFREAVRLYGPFTEASKERARGIIEGSIKLPVGGATLRCKSETDGRESAVFVIAATAHFRK